MIVFKIINGEKTICNVNNDEINKMLLSLSLGEWEIGKVGNNITLIYNYEYCTSEDEDEMWLVHFDGRISELSNDDMNYCDINYSNIYHNYSAWYKSGVDFL